MGSGSNGHDKEAEAVVVLTGRVSLLEQGARSQRNELTELVAAVRDQSEMLRVTRGNVADVLTKLDEVLLILAALKPNDGI